MAGSPRRESPGVGVRTEEQVGLRDKNVPCRYFSHGIPSCNSFCTTAVKDIKNRRVFILQPLCFL